MEVKPNYCSMDTVFGESTVFVVPKYQRAYSWDKSNVKQFCEDLFSLYSDKVESNNVGQHFFGGIVCVRQGNEDELDEKVVYQLVDGQQRLSTTVLLVSRIVFLLRDLKLSGDDSEIRDKRVSKYISKFINLITEENGRDSKFERITLSKRDREYYSQALLDIFSDSKIKSHQLIRAAKVEIDDWLKKFKGVDDKDTLNNLDLMYRVLGKSCKILLLKMTDVNDAYRLFQVINDRGRSLTAGDLLRASSLGEVDLAGLTNVNLDVLEDKWDRITQGGVKTTDDKLITYYTSKLAKSSKRANLFEDFNKSFFSDPKLIPERIFDIESKVLTLEKLSSGIWPYENSKYTEHQKYKLYNLVVQFKHTHCLPLLLAATSLKENKFYQLIFFLEKFFFLFKVLLDKRMTSVTKAYYNAISSINISPENYQVKRFCLDLKEIVKNISETEVLTKLTEVRYVENGDNKDLKYIFSTIEESWSWILSNYKSGWLGLYRHHAKCFISGADLSIEHIYPNNAKNSDVDGSLELVKNNIGNLTLLYRQDNERCGNSLINNKVNIYDASRLNVAKSLSHKATFTDSDYEKRKVEIETMFLNIFSLGFGGFQDL